MRNRIASLLFNQVGVLLGLIFVAFVAYVIIGQPAWVIDPLRGAASDVLGGMGVGLVLLLAWVGWLAWLLRRGSKTFLRRWRYVSGFGLLMAGAFAALSYFHASFPLVGDSPLGGALGGDIRGAYGALGVFRTVVLVTLGAWLVAPVLFNHAAAGIARGVHATGRGIGSGVGRLRNRDDGSVMQEVDEYLASNVTASRGCSTIGIAGGGRVPPAAGGGRIPSAAAGGRLPAADHRRLPPDRTAARPGVPGTDFAAAPGSPPCGREPAGAAGAAEG